MANCGYILVAVVALTLFAHANSAPDPDFYLNAEEYIISRQFIPETHEVVTKDGIILTLHRIINPRVTKVSKLPVLLMHPLLGSSVDFMYNSPGGVSSESTDFVGNNLAFELSKRGHDVWLGNVRGNIYSSRNLDKKKWDFSFDEFIAYDLPAMVDHVLRDTNSSKINYIGHSQGTLIMFGLLSTQPRFNSLVNRFIALGPAVHLNNVARSVRMLVNSPPFRLYLKSCNKFFYNPTAIKSFTRYLCPYTGPLCQSALGALVGYDYEQLNKTRLPVYVNHIPVGTSCKNLRHYSQQFTSNGLTMFDMGGKYNLLKYGTVHPPEYKINQISLNNSISLIYGLNDFMATPVDVERIKSDLKVTLADFYLVPDEKWNHLDFIWAKQTGKLINSKIIEILNRD